MSARRAPKLVVQRVDAGEYRVLRGGEYVGDLVLDGRRGVDDYPWTWSIAIAPFGSGPAATKRSALERLTARMRVVP